MKIEKKVDFANENLEYTGGAYFMNCLRS